MVDQARCKALIVEDEAVLRTLLAALFDEAELDVVECESAEAALAFMLLAGPQVAVIISDLRLGGSMDGVDFAREARMRWPHLPFVLISGNAGDRLDHLPPGAVFMTKPWREAEILKIASQAKLLASRRTIYGR